MKKNILITNDDGYYAPGFLALVERLHSSENYNIFAAAPLKQQSGVGHGITLFSSLCVHKITLDRPSLYDVRSYAVDGTPADCTKVAITNLFKDIKFDLVISGINAGVNVGTGVLYSGTVAAALEANLNGIASIAVSLDFPKESLWHYETAASKTLEILEKIPLDSLNPDMCINVNMPNLSSSDLQGFALTKQGLSNYNEYYIEEEDSGGRKRYQLEGKMNLLDSTMESDYYALTKGYISISLLSADMSYPASKMDKIDKINKIESWPIFQ